MPDKILDDDAIKQLSAYARAQEAANQIEQRKLQALLRRENIFLAIVETTQQLTSDVRELLQCMRERNLADDAVREFFIELSEQIERLERNQVLLLTEHNQSGIARAIEDTVGNAAQRKLMRQYLKNLAHLREQAAIYGTDVPLELVNKIERTLEDIERLKKEMN